MRNDSDECRKKINTHASRSMTFFQNRTVYEIMWKKYCRFGQATNHNMAHAHCLLDN